MTYIEQQQKHARIEKLLDVARLRYLLWHSTEVESAPEIGVQLEQELKTLNEARVKCLLGER